MKNLYFRFLLLLVCVVLFAGAEQIPKAPATPQEDAPIATCSKGDQSLTPRQMFDYINEQRKRFEKHAPYNGYPWQGAYTNASLWPIQMTWSEELSRKAQTEAANLAGGTRPSGRRFRHQLAGLYGDRVEDMWLRGLDSPLYEIVGSSRPETEPENTWHASNNGTMRLAILYQTGAGEHPVKTRLGVGKACLASGQAWWVLLVAD